MVFLLLQLCQHVTNAIFQDDLRGKVSGMRQNLQVEYVNRLSKIIDPKNKKHDHLSASMALYELRRIQNMEKTATASDLSTKAHRQRVIFDIDQALTRYK